MRPDLEQYYLIDQYLENKLKGEELAAFENQLIQNESFANEVQEQRMLNDLILEAELKDVRSQIEKDLFNIQNPSFFRMHWQWISAGVLCLFGALFFIIPGKKNPAPAIQQPVAIMEQKNNAVIQPAENSVQQTEKPLSEKRVVKTDAGTALNRTISADTAQAVSDLVSVTPAIVPVITKTEPHTETKLSEENKKTDCSSTKITFAFTTETSCMQTETGAIHIDNITGGHAPYTFTVNNKKIKEKNLTALGAGLYDIKIADKNGCYAEQKATILEKNCVQNIQQGAKFNINPAIGETCAIPFDTDKKGSVTVYNRSGKIVYRSVNPSGEYVEWNGSDGYGSLAEAGLYVYIIDYSDGTKVSGEVNIIR